MLQQWMRELQNHTRYKIRRFGMHNECLYFLCGSDDRWCRAAGVDSDGLHCTAFVRVYDYRVRGFLCHLIYSQMQEQWKWRFSAMRRNLKQPTENESFGISDHFCFKFISKALILSLSYFMPLDFHMTFFQRLRRHETKVLRIQYCLDHCFHNG